MSTAVYFFLIYATKPDGKVTGCRTTLFFLVHKFVILMLMLFGNENKARIMIILVVKGTASISNYERN
jgi:hypothetical protein